MGVSIVTKNLVDGDALSTATFDKGLEKGYQYIERRRGTDAIFITKDKKVYVTSDMKSIFKLFNDSRYKLAQIKTR